jgi:hypothetical protein
MAVCQTVDEPMKWHRPNQDERWGNDKTDFNRLPVFRGLFSTVGYSYSQICCRRRRKKQMPKTKWVANYSATKSLDETRLVKIILSADVVCTELMMVI